MALMTHSFMALTGLTLLVDMTLILFNLALPKERFSQYGRREQEGGGGGGRGGGGAGKG